VERPVRVFVLVQPDGERVLFRLSPLLASPSPTRRCFCGLRDTACSFFVFPVSLLTAKLHEPFKDFPPPFSLPSVSPVKEVELGWGVNANFHSPIFVRVAASWYRRHSSQLMTITLDPPTSPREQGVFQRPGDLPEVRPLMHLLEVRRLVCSPPL